MKKGGNAIPFREDSAQQQRKHKLGVRRTQGFGNREGLECELTKPHRGGLERGEGGGRGGGEGKEGQGR